MSDLGFLGVRGCGYVLYRIILNVLLLTVGLSIRDFGSGSDADRKVGSSDYFASTAQSGSEIQSSSAMRVVCVQCGAHATPQ